MLKLSLPAGNFDQAVAYKAAIGQRGLNLRNVTESIKALTSDYETGTMLNVRFVINRREATYEVSVIGPTSTHAVKSALSNHAEGSSFDDSDVEKVYLEFKDHWLTLSTEKGAKSMIRGKLISMGGVYVENEKR